MTGRLAFVASSYAPDRDGAIVTYGIGGNGGLARRDGTPAGENPNFLAIGGDHVYAVTDDDGGSLRSFAIDREAGTLDRHDRGSTGARGPRYVSVEAEGRYALVAHYRDGSVSVLPIDGGRIAAPSHVVEHEGSGPDPERQAEPHPHSIVPGPDNRFAYAPDLGTDRVEIYRMDLDAGRLDPADPGGADVHGGAGPRHIDFGPEGRFAYLVNELDSTVTAFERDPATGAIEPIGTESTLPPDFEGESKAADVHVHPSGRWLYASNRGHDSVAVFAIGENGVPESRGHEPTRGETPRNIAVGRGYLYAENKDSATVVAFRIGDDGSLSPTGGVAEVHKPACMVLD